MQSIRFVCKFNVRGAFYPHPGVRSPLHGQTLFMFLLVIVGPVYCIFQLQMEFAQENVFCTEIYSDTQLMQKYRDISLKGGFLPHATLN